jgi:hypothetical protein
VCCVHRVISSARSSATRCPRRFSFGGGLTVQLILLLRRLGGIPSILAGIILAEIIFTVPHLFLFMRLGISWTDLWMIFADGVALAALYLITDNLLIAVGAHALSNCNMLVFRDPGGFIDAHAGLIYIGLALVIAAPWILWRPEGTRAFLSRLSRSQ